jgi:flagellar biosynthesis protein FlhG
LFYGVKAQGHIGEVIDGTKELRDILVELSQNVFLIPGGSGVVELQHMNHFQKRAMLESIQDLPMTFDSIIIDTAPGISDHVLYFNSAAQENYVVLTPDPASFADSYALVKVLFQKFKKKKFSVIVNQVKDDQEGLLIFSKFQDIVAQFLHVKIDFMGCLQFDQQLKRAVQAQRLILKQDPNAVSSRGIQAIISEIQRTGNRSGTRTSANKFWSQVVGMA